MVRYEKGLKLYSLAKQRARIVGLETGKIGMMELIWKIQEREGNTTCFRRQRSCAEALCCWQAACGAEMVEG